MCGIFFFCDTNKNNLSLIKENIYEITDSIKKRGPDHFLLNQGEAKDTYWIGINTILSIRTSRTNISPALIKANKSGFFAYNGETYEPNTTNIDDTDFFKKLISIEADLYKTNHYQGYFAYAKLDHDRLTFGVDFLSEKPLFYWKCDNKFCISSDLKTILLLKNKLGISTKLNKNKCKEYFLTRHLIQYHQTIYEGIFRCLPGYQYSFKLSDKFLKEISLEESLKFSREHLNNINKYNQKDLLEITLEYIKSSLSDLKDRDDVGYIISGGVDSTLISLLAYEVINKKQNNNMRFLTLTFGDKDIPAKMAQDLTRIFSENHLIIDVSKNEYLNNLKYLYKNLCMPMPTHSFPSYSVLCDNASKQKCRILVGGEGADEIYNGYELYKNIKEQISLNHGSLSPYSALEDKYKLFEENLYELKCSSDLFRAYNEISCENDKWLQRVEKSLFLDAFIQCPSTGLLCADQVGGLWGIESRSPLANPKAMAWRFINLPNQKNNQFYDSKKVLREELSRLSKIWASKSPPKQGFSGFPNEIFNLEILKLHAKDLAEILNVNYKDIDKNIGKRDFDWKIFNMGEFIKTNIKLINL